MFKKLKEKIAEEVKQSPLKIQQLAQSVVSPGSSSVVEPASNENFSIGDDDAPQDALGKEGFTVVDLHHPSTPQPSVGGRISRQSSMSSLASDASSAFFSIHDSSLGAFNVQMDLESASEKEDALPQLNSISKEELYHAYMRLHRHYQKYKGRAHDLRSYCRELDKDNKKHKAVLLECQEKSLRRMAELKEQCSLEQHAKAHLEEALRNDLEEKDHLIQTLQTKIKLLKETLTTYSATRSASVDENIPLSIEGETTPENSKDFLDFKETPVLAVAAPAEASANEQTMNLLFKSIDEGNLKALKGKLDLFQRKILGGSQEDMDISCVLRECQEILNPITAFIDNCAITGDAFAPDNRHLVVNDLAVHQCVDSSGDKDFERHKALGQDSDILDLSKLVVKQEKFCNILHKISRTFEEISSSVIADDYLLDKPENVVESSFCGILNEMHALKDEYVKENQTDYEIHVQDEENLKNKFNKQMENSLDALMHVMQKYNVLEKNVLILNKNVKDTREAESLLKQKDDELNQIKKELEKTVSQNSKLNDELTLLQKDLGELKQKEEIACQSLLVMERKLKETELNCKKLHNELETQQGDTKEIAQQKNEVENAFKASQSDLCELKQKYDLVCQEMMTLQEKHKQHDEMCVRLSSELAAVRLDLEESISKRTELSELYSECQKEQSHAKATYKSDLDQLVKDREQSQQEIIELRRKFDKSEERCEQLEKKLVSSQQKTVEENASISRMEEDLEKALREKEKLVETAATAEKVLEEYKQKCQMLEEELASIQKKDMLEGSKLHGELSSLRMELTSSVDENVKLNEMVGDLQKEVSSMRKQCEQVTQELASDKQIIREQDMSCTQLTVELTATKKSLEETLGKECALKETLASLQKDIYNTKNTYEKISRELEFAQMEKSERESRYVNLEAELHMARKELFELLLKNSEISKQLADRETQCNKVEKDYEEAIQNLVSAQEQIKQHNLLVVADMVAKCRELEEVSREKDEVNRKFLACQDEFREFKELTFSDLTSVNEKLTESKKKLTEYEENLAASQTGLHEAISVQAELEKTVASLEGELQLVRRQNQEANQQLEMYRDEIKDSDQRIKDMERELFNTSEDLKVSKEKLVKACEEVESLRIDNTQLAGQLELVNAKIKESNCGSTELKEELLTAQRDLEETLHQKDELEKAFEASQNELVVLKQNYDQIRQEVASLQDKCKERNEGSTHLKAELAATHVELEEATCKRTELNELFLECQKELSEMKSKYSEMAEQLSSAQMMVQEKSVLSSQLEEKLEESLIRKKEMDERTKCLEKELHKTVEICEQLRTEVNSSQEKVEVDETSGILDKLSLTQDELQKSSREKEQLEKTVKIVKQELEDCTDKLWMMEEELASSRKKIQELKETATNVRGEVDGERLIIPEEISSCTIEPADFSSMLGSDSERRSHSSLNSSEDRHGAHKNGGREQPLVDEDTKVFHLSHAGSVHKSEETETHHGVRSEKSVESLRDRLSSLTRELYETKEKYRQQMAAANKSDSVEPDWDKMSMEMEYLRNILYQYMIGKEPMLLAKVISAVMKFDQQQIDQIMQKELHKQTLLGQLGIL